MLNNDELWKTAQRLGGTANRKCPEDREIMAISAFNTPSSLTEKHGAAESIVYIFSCNVNK